MKSPQEIKTKKINDDIVGVAIVYGNAGVWHMRSNGLVYQHQLSFLFISFLFLSFIASIFDADSMRWQCARILLLNSCYKRMLRR